MNESIEESSNDKPSARRRLVVRGTFAAPAALTLFSGGVAARSLRNCVTKQLEAPIPAPASTSTQEGSTYVRVQLRKFTRGSSTTKWSRWVPGFAIEAKKAAGQSVFLTDGNWMLFDKGSESAYANLAVGAKRGSKPDEGLGTTDTGDNWVALRIDKDGNILGAGNIIVQADASPTSAVWQSCWTSFRLG